MNGIDKKLNRKLTILGHIVHAYVATAVPVSSRSVAENMGGSVSSATVRNIMAELEEEGYIKQPHTSAGRIPTNTGYRVYVDMVKKHISTQRQEARRLAIEYSERIRTINEVIKRTTYLINRELHNAGIFLWPSIGDFYLKHLELVKVKTETVLAILVTMTNAVRNYIVRLDREPDKAELDRITNFINSKYEHATISSIYDDLRQISTSGDDEAGADIISMAEESLKIIDSIIEENIEDELYLEGLECFMDGADFQDIEVARRILRTMSNRKELISLMRRELPSHDVRVYIGQENRCETLAECSIITCGYEMYGRAVGRIGVIGPTRMDYERALGTVSCLAGIISRKLEEINC